MNNLVRKLLIITIFLSSTQIISLPYGNLSLFQIVLILTVCVSLLSIIIKSNIKKGQYLLFALVSAFSSILAYMMSTNQSWAKSYLLLGFMASIFVFLIPNYFTKDDIALLEKTLIRSQYITILFSVYSFYHFYFQGGIPKQINLFAGLYIKLDEEFLLRGQAAGQLRLSIPYATPPVLSVVMAICIVILIMDSTLFSKRKRIFLLLCFSAILLFTGSRTGLFGLIVVFGIMGLNILIRKKIINYKMFVAVIVIFFATFLFIVLKGNSEYLQKMIRRFLSIDLLTDRHLLVPLDGILIWIGSYKNFILGIGFGSSINMVGQHTYLPPYFLNSFVTLIVERGLLGLYMVCEIVRLAAGSIRKRKKLSKRQNTMVMGVMVGLVSCISYEALNCYFLIILIAICYIVDERG